MIEVRISSLSILLASNSFCIINCFYSGTWKFLSVIGAALEKAFMAILVNSICSGKILVSTAERIEFILSGPRHSGLISSHMKPRVYSDANLTFMSSEFEFSDSSGRISFHCPVGTSITAIAATQVAAALITVVSVFASMVSSASLIFSLIS